MNNRMSSDSANEFPSQSNSLNTSIKLTSPISISAQNGTKLLDLETENLILVATHFAAKSTFTDMQSLQTHINKTHPKEKAKQIYLLKLEVSRGIMQF